MDRGDVESDCGMQDRLAGLYQLLRNADGSAAAIDGHGEICRHDAEIRSASRLDGKN
jgi:hypothetical protein